MSPLHEEVPDVIATFYKYFPHVLPRAERDHTAAADGFCQSCFKPWPCDIQRWVHILLEEHRIPRTTLQPPQHVYIA